METPLIKAENISKRYNIALIPSLPRLFKTLVRWKSWKTYIWALRELSFSAAGGDSLAIVGRNGSGKSTLLKILCGITTPTTGSVGVNGRLIPLLAIASSFHGELTAKDNLFIYGLLLGMLPNRIREKMNEILEFSEVKDFQDVPIKRYSAGMLTKLGVSATVFSDPDILVMDEVLNVLDIKFRKKLYDLTEEMCRKGKLILSVSHNPEESRRLARRGILLEQGRIVADGDIDRVLQRYLEGESSKVRIMDVAIEPMDGGSIAQGSTVAFNISLQNSAHIGSQVLVGVSIGHQKLEYLRLTKEALLSSQHDISLMIHNLDVPPGDSEVNVVVRDRDGSGEVLDSRCYRLEVLEGRCALPMSTSWKVPQRLL